MPGRFASRSCCDTGTRCRGGKNVLTAQGRQWPPSTSTVLAPRWAKLIPGSSTARRKSGGNACEPAGEQTAHRLSLTGNPLAFAGPSPNLCVMAEDPEIAAELPALVPQAHGGAVYSGGVPGHRGGPGRPPSALRERLRGSFEDRVSVLEAIADDEEGDPQDRIRAVDVLAKYG